MASVVQFVWSVHGYRPAFQFDSSFCFIGFSIVARFLRFLLFIDSCSTSGSVVMISTTITHRQLISSAVPRAGWVLFRSFVQNLHRGGIALSGVFIAHVIVARSDRSSSPLRHHFRRFTPCFDALVIDLYLPASRQR